MMDGWMNGMVWVMDECDDDDDDKSWCVLIACMV